MYIFKEEEPFFAIIGDIKKSREIKMRDDIQKKLRTVLNEINKKYEADITSKFLITIGDEFQGLLSGGENILRIIHKIKAALYPVELRFGIGVGEITTEIDTEMALGADGPGYYNARMAIEILRNNEKKKKTIPSDIRLEMDNGNTSQILLINTVFELIKTIEQSWTERQREIIWDMLTYQDGQKDAASRLGIMQSSVQKALVRGHYYTYENAMKNVESILGEVGYD